jgi:hypothetical protein
VRMLEFLDLQGVINPGQYGFRFGHCSAMVIQDIVERVRGAWDSKRVALGVFTDLKKAIDTGSSYWASAPKGAKPSHLITYESSFRPSVRPSVRLSVRLSVHPYVRTGAYLSYENSVALFHLAFISHMIAATYPQPIAAAARTTPRGRSTALIIFSGPNNILLKPNM